MYFYLKEPKVDKATLIYLIYYSKNDKKYFKYSTGQKIEPIDWDFVSRYPKLKRGSAGKLNKQISLVLDNYKDFLEDLIDDYDKSNTQFTKSDLKKSFDKKFKGVSNDLELSNIITESLRKFIDTKMKSGVVTRSWEIKYNNLLNKLILFDNHTKRTTNFKDINENWIDSYCGFLRNFPELVNKKKAKSLNATINTEGYNDNTLHRHINFLFTFLNWSKNNFGIQLNIVKNPIKKYDTDDIHLTSSEVKLIENVELEKESHQRVRDIFLIGVYSGQRFSDYSVFEREDVKGDMIIKRAEKTENESFIPLHDKLVNLLNKYNWKIPKISGQKFNPHIKKVCELAGIDDKIKTTTYKGLDKDIEYFDKWELVSSHTARRTFITLSAEKGMPDHVIMKITGIRDPKTLIKYKKTNQKTVSEFMNKIWS